LAGCPKVVAVRPVLYDLTVYYPEQMDVLDGVRSSRWLAHRIDPASDGRRRLNVVLPGNSCAASDPITFGDHFAYCDDLVQESQAFEYLPYGCAVDHPSMVQRGWSIERRGTLGIPLGNEL
jgi:hypothetical protein